MNNLRSCIKQTLLLLACIGHTSLIKGVIISVSVMQLPKDNRCIILHDCHIVEDECDKRQLEAVLQALVDREKETDRPLRILTESTLENTKLSRGESILLSLRANMRSWEALNDEELSFKHTSVENIEVREFYLAVSSILQAKENTPSKENRYLYSYSSKSWRQGSISFNDFFTNFNELKEAAAKTYTELLTICETEDEIEWVKHNYTFSINKTQGLFDKYVTFLQQRNIDPCSTESMYLTTLSWPQTVKEELSDVLLVECFSIFFDFNGFARIFTLHKKHTSLDIALIAGGDHCWEISNMLFMPLHGETTYSLRNDLKHESEVDIAPEMLYAILQEKTPIRENNQSWCTLF